MKAVIVNDTRVDRHFGCTRVVDTIIGLAKRHGADVIATAPAHRDWRTNAAFRASFDAADLVIVNGEGTIHHDRPAAIPLLAAGAMARAAGKKSAIVNMSWFANRAELGDTLKDFDLVAVRESESLAAVKPFRPDCRLVPDLLFAGDKMAGGERHGIGFGDSVVEPVRQALMEARKRHGGRFVSILCPDRSPGGMARFLRAHVGRKTLTRPMMLVDAVRTVALHIVHADEGPRAHLEKLAGLELLVTGRFHGIALALCAGTPILAMGSNTRKIEAMIGDIGLRPWRMVDGAPTPALIEKASRWHAGERQAVEAYLERATAAADQLFRDIGSLA